MNSRRTPDSAALRMFEHLEPVDAGEGDPPILTAAEPTTCSQCGARHAASEFLALPLADEGSVWKVDGVTLVIRRCAGIGCNKVLGRRVA